jgi:antitoxin (DNA-binding transcriptional repressor) of toxin-antitoxin stability system
MKAMPVGEVKTHFSEVLEEVKQGNRIGILYGRTRKPVAMIVPYIEEKTSRRKIGILDGKIEILFKDDFEMTTEELLDMQ